MARPVGFLLSLYRKLALPPSNCRYYPSCSHYAEEAVDKYGWLKGGFLALNRLIRCNQYFDGGFDPIP